MKQEGHKIKRFPRPLGITAAIQEYHKEGNPEILNKIQTWVIQQWIVSNSFICGRTWTIQELSKFLRCEPERVRKQMVEQMLNSKIWNKDTQAEILDSLMAQQVTWALEDRMEIEHQLGILKSAQKERYTPFVTSEVNKAIDMKMKSSSNLQSIVRSLTGGGSVNIFQQINQSSTPINNSVTIEEAIEIVQEHNKEVNSPQEVKYLEAKYDMSALPEVVATKQEGINTDKEGLTLNRPELNRIVDNYKKTLSEFDEEHHDIRREIEEGIILDGDDPEIAIY